MDSEKQLLEIISAKEEILKKESDIVQKEAEEILVKARQQSSLILNLADKEGKELADTFFQQEMQVLKADICQIQSDGITESEEIRTRGNTRIPRAVAKIISIVTG